MIRVPVCGSGFYGSRYTVVGVVELLVGKRGGRSGRGFVCEVGPVCVRERKRDRRCGGGFG